MRVSLWFSLIVLLLGSCQEDSTSIPFEVKEVEPEWLIPSQFIRDGGVGRDGIPSIDNPVFWNTIQGDNFMSAEDLVVLVKHQEVVKAYPYKIMNYHEIVNDQIANRYFALNYCPLTGTSMAWNRNLKLGVTTFGVSGLLYQSNLIPFDRETESDWSQMLKKSVRGFYQGDKIISFQVLETTWATAKELYPDLQVLSTETGFDRQYQLYPYGEYLTADAEILFPIIPVDYRLDFKERVHSIIVDDKAMVFRQKLFANGPKLIQNEFNSKPFVIYGDSKRDIIVSFSRELNDGHIIDFKLSDDQLHLTDQQGNTWDLFGDHLSGPSQNVALKSIEGITGYWFTFGSFYPDPIIYGE